MNKSSRKAGWKHRRDGIRVNKTIGAEARREGSGWALWTKAPWLPFMEGAGPFYRRYGVGGWRFRDLSSSALSEEGVTGTLFIDGAPK